MNEVLVNLSHLAPKLKESRALRHLPLLKKESTKSKRDERNLS